MSTTTAFERFNGGEWSCNETGRPYDVPELLKREQVSYRFDRLLVDREGGLHTQGGLVSVYLQVLYAWREAARQRP